MRFRAGGGGASVPPLVTRAEAEAGVLTDLRSWTPERIKQAIDALANGITKTVYFDWEQTSADGDYRGRQVTGSGSGRTSFVMPPDFGSLISLEVIGIPNAAIVGENIDLDSDYAAPGEDAQAHSETDAAFTVSAADNEMLKFSIASVFNSLAAGDVCGFKASHQAIGASITYLMTKLVYTPL